ncbi:MAG: virulence protein RhuM/Fic/DOC family protein [Candidatus Pacebacteria bacterium]|nr:virulence protein RhuM/Fic/DOC family protein [Candidatus Paceibacterota bacterium]
MKKEIENRNNNLVIYQTKGGALELRGDFTHDTLWATQAQIATVFDIERSVVTKHISNVFKTGEVDEKSNVQKMHIAQSDKPVSLYSLDIILAVGYRTNSSKAISFRQWATKTLRQHIVEGYTINPDRIGHNYATFMKAVERVQAVLPPGDRMEGKEVLELVKLFADTWFSLDAYDKELLSPKKVSKKKVQLTAEELVEGLAVLKRELVKKGEATENFAQPRTAQSLEGIVGNVMQSFGGQAMYPTVEGKAAHLLYFIIKNHPFVDGNKRSGAYAFVWFLRKARVLDMKRLSPTALTALTLLIAESDPKDKEKVTALVTMLIAKR